ANTVSATHSASTRRSATRKRSAARSCQPTRMVTTTTWPTGASKRSSGSAGSCDLKHAPLNIERGARHTIAVMHHHHRLALALAAVVGCSSGAPPPRNLPPATPSTTLGPSDLFEVSVVGEKDLPKEY